MMAQQDELDVSAPKQPISHEKVGELIREIEVRHDLLQYEVDGWCIWPALRFPVALTLMALPFTRRTEHFTLKELLRISVKELPRLVFPRKSRYAVITYSSAFMEKEGEAFIDVFFDDLLRELGSFFKIEKLNSKSFLTRSKAALIKSDVTSTTFDLLCGIIFRRLGGPREIANVATKLSASLTSEPGLDRFSPRYIAAIIEDFYWRKKLYRWLLGRLRSNYLFSADGYSDHAAVAAAKERKIKVCEFQHGGFMRRDAAYGWSSYASNYKAKMPVPDEFFLFGEYWKQQLEGDGFWEGHLLAVGSTRMDRYRERRNQSRRTDGLCNIVLTTQGIDTQKLIAFISEFLRLVEGKLDINLRIKLHPVHESDKAVYETPFLADARVKVISGNETPSTFELLVDADIHLSISSSCHYDALALGVPTVILPLANSSWVLPLHRSGHAFLAPTPESLLEIVLSRPVVSDDIGSYYFKPDALENIRRTLEA